MHKARKLNFPFITSIIVLAFWVVTTALITFGPLNFTSSATEDSFTMFRFWGLPVTILLTLSGTLSKTDSNSSQATKILLTIFIAIASLLFLVILLFMQMCGWSNGRAFLENRKSPSVKITKRYYGCGATDSSPDSPGIFKVRPLTPYFYWATEVDTATLNMEDWRRIENPKN